MYSVAKKINGYKSKGVQKVRAGEFETSKYISTNVGDRQNKHIRKLGNPLF